MFREGLKIPHYFRVQRFCFAAIGIDLTAEKRIVVNNFLNLVPTIALTALCICICHYAVANIKDIDKVTDALSPFWQGSLAIFKWVICMYKRREIVGLVRKIWRWNMEATAAVELEILAVENRKDILFCNIYHICVAATGVLAVFGQLLAKSLVYLKSGRFTFEPPLKASYFMDNAKPINCIFIIAWDCFAVYLIIYSSVAVDTLFSWFTHNVLAQFRILQRRFEQAGLASGSTNAASIIESCIHYHQRAIALSEQLNQVFGAIIFLKFIVSCTQICCLAYQFSRGGPWVELVYHFSFLTSVSLQMMLYCYNGQRIQDESFNVANCVYDSFQWQILSQPARKLLLITIIRAQRACNLAGVFFIVDLTLFLWVFRTAASYVMILFTLDDK